MLDDLRSMLQSIKRDRHYRGLCRYVVCYQLFNRYPWPCWNVVHGCNWRVVTYFIIFISSCGRQSVDQFVWVSGFPLGPLTRFYLVLLSSCDNYFILLSKAPSLTRKRVCSLQCNHSLVRLLTPNNHTLPSHLRLCSLFVASTTCRDYSGTVSLRRI
jgi:hypothetical protein